MTFAAGAVAFDLGFDPPALSCPRCSSPYLHQGRVTVYDRGEDDESTAVTTIANGLTSTRLRPSGESGNPSARRHGLAIAFDCEDCGECGELTIAQHKGQTFVAWRPGVVG